MINAKYLSPDAQFAFACFLKAEINRHVTDIGNALHDLHALRQLGVDVEKASDIGFVTTEDEVVDSVDTGLVFVPTEDMSYSFAQGMIKAYIKNAGHRRVYISELAEALHIDIDLIKQILSDMGGLDEPENT